MKTKQLIVCSVALAVTVLWAGGCRPISNGDGNTNANTNGNDNGSAGLPYSSGVSLGSQGWFDISDGGPAQGQVDVSLSEDLGMAVLDDLAIALEPDDVDLRPLEGGDNPETAFSTLEVFIATAEAEDACADGSSIGSFEIDFGTNGSPSVSPEQLAADADALDRAQEGEFTLCMRARSDTDHRLAVARLEVRYDTTTPALSCDGIMNLSAVQSAMDTLLDNGLSFTRHEGDDPANIEGTYAVVQTVEFDPDETDSGQRSERTDTFSEQGEGTILRTSGEASLTQHISGNAENVSLCVFARSHNPACDQTIARLESYSVGEGGSVLSGEFLAVVVERHGQTASECGTAGDFIYGTIDLSRQSETFEVSRRGKVALPEDFTPHYLVLPSGQGRGSVTDLNTAAALQYTRSAPFDTRALAVPGQLDANGYNGIALSPDHTKVAMVSNNPDELLVFNNTEASLISETAAQEASLTGHEFDFSPDSRLVYVVSPDRGGDEDGIAVFDTSPQAAGSPLLARVPTPDARTPDLSRLSPDGTQLAVLLHGQASEGNSQYLTFLDLESREFSPPIDLSAETDGYVSNRYLVYSRDGSQVFMAGAGGVTVALTSDPYTVAVIDVSGGEGDDPAAIALSNDGRVLAVAVDQVNGDTNFAIIDVDQLEVINRQLLEDLENRGAIDVFHFGTGRACLVLNVRSVVIPVQTVEPFAVGEALSAADDENATVLGLGAVGGNLIAIGNPNEPAIYLFELAP